MRCRGLREVLWVRWRMLPSGIRAMEVGREANVVLGKGEVFGLGVGERGDVGVGSSRIKSKNTKNESTVTRPWRCILR